MGIDGLLNFLKPVTQKQHISTFKNQRAGIDVMSWIYRGCYSCNWELAQNIESCKYLYYLLEMVEVLAYYNIKPIFVFDGRSLDLKAQTNNQRIKEKQEFKAKANELIKQGKNQQARKYLSRCIFIDEKIISTTINVMVNKNIDFIIAPYEADCQVAKLKKQGLIDVAISQDSDLLVYGVNTILKLNQNGDCDYVDPNKWTPKDVDNQFLKQYFAMKYVNRVESAILAGSDYNPSIKGIGIKRAVKNLYRQGKMSNVINKLKQQKIYSDKVSENYIDLTEKAKMIFLFATVYNPNTRKLEFLNPNLIEQYKPQLLTNQELLQIVGVQYEGYIEKQVFSGKARAKDLTTRQIISVSIREHFSIHKQNMCAHEAINKKRKQQLEKLREQRELDIKNGVIKITDMLPQKNVHIVKTEKKISELTSQEKQKKKTQRKNRIVKLQDVMKTLVKNKDQNEADQQNQSEGEEKKDENPQNQLLELQKKLNDIHSLLGLHKDCSNNNESKEESEINEFLQDQQKRQSSLQKSEKEEHEVEKEEQEKDKKQFQQQGSSLEEQESESLDLAFLNPEQKVHIQNQPTAVKVHPRR